MKVQDITFEKKPGGFGGGMYQMKKSGAVYTVSTCADMRLYIRRSSGYSLKIEEMAQICGGCSGNGDCPLCLRFVDFMAH